MTPRENLKEIIAESYLTGGQDIGEEMDELVYELALSPAFGDVLDLFDEIKKEMKNDLKYKDLMANVEVVNNILANKYGKKREN